jgi:hypothetical protein
MKFLLTCSIKRKQKLLDSRTSHSNGELRLVEFPDDDARLIEGEHGRWIRISESSETIMQGHHKVNGGCFQHGEFYVATFGQVLRVNLQQGSSETVWTASFLNDLHAVNFFHDRMYVVNTGLERIEIVDPQSGTHQASIDLQKYIGSSRTFDLSLDYRHVWTTQPHLVHANHCFLYDNEVWVTRFCQMDALALESRRRIDLSSWGNPHDGLVQENEVFFTTTNGHLVSYCLAADRFQSWDLNDILGRDQLGWCRGLAVSDNVALVAFTQFRPSVTKEMGKWILQDVKLQRNPSFIVKLDLERNRVLAKYDFQERDLTIYGIYRIDR